MFVIAGIASGRWREETPRITDESTPEREERMIAMLPLQIGIPGRLELLIILLVVVLLFGANKLPALTRSSGQAIGEFQKGREEIQRGITFETCLERATDAIEYSHLHASDVPDLPDPR